MYLARVTQSPSRVWTHFISTENWIVSLANFKLATFRNFVDKI